MERLYASIKIGALLAMIFASPAGADDPITEKPGYHIENFRIRPSLSITQEYDDNVFTTERHTLSDWITVAAPSIKIDSTWAEHSLQFHAGAESATHWEYDNEDYLDYWAGGEGRYHLNATTDLFAGLGVRHEHEGRDSPDSAMGQLEPTTYRVFNADAGIRTRYSDIGFRMGGTYEELDFDNAPAVSGRIINDDRDRELLGAGVRATRDLDEQQQVFLQLRYDQRNYDLRQDQLGFERSSQGYRAALGLMQGWDDSNRVEAYLGIISQSYEDSRFDDVRKLDFGGRLTLVLARGNRITMRLQRSLDETTEPGSPGYINTAISGRLEHRSTPRLTPYLNLGYSDYDFLETGRTDKTYSAGGGLKYFVTRNTHIVLGASHRSRDSNDRGRIVGSNDFDQTSVFLNLTARLYPLR